MAEGAFIQLHHLLAAAWRRRYLMVSPLLLMPLAGLAVGWFSPRQWETHTTILIQETAKLNPFLEDLSVSTNLKERMAALDALLHSRHVLLGVGEDLGRIDRSADNRTRDRLVDELSAALTVRLVGGDLVKLSYRSRTPEGIAATLEAVARRFVDQLLAPESSSISGSERFLGGQLDGRREELREAEGRLARFKEAHAAELPELHGANVTRLRQLSETIAERATELAGARAARETVRARLAQLNPVVGRLEEQIIAVAGELALLRARYTEGHSQVRAALRKLKRLEAERGGLIAAGRPQGEGAVERLWQLADGRGDEGGEGGGGLLAAQLRELQLADGRVTALEQELASLEGQLRELDGRVAGFGGVERELAELERDLRVKRGLYDDLLERFERARVTGALGRFEQPERIKVIDAPFTPGRPTNPPPLLFLVGGLFGGLALGIGLALFAEAMDTTVRRRDRLMAIVGAPVLTRIPVLPGTQAVSH